MIKHFDPTINVSLENKISILDQKDEDIRSLKELITYGLKGMAAYNLSLIHISTHQLQYMVMHLIIYL